MTDPKGYEKPNHTQVPNSFFDSSLKEIKSLMELKILLAIIRQTFGWHKERDRISLSQLQTLTGMPRQSVQRGIAAALTHGYIQREPVGQGFFYSLNLLGTRCDQAPDVTSNTECLKVGTKSDQELGTRCDTQKKGIKEKKEKGVARANGSGKDPLLANPHVVAYRDVCRLTPNAEQRKLIADSVKDATLWDSVLRKFMGEGRSPQRVDWLLERYAKGNGSSTRPTWMASAK